MKKHTIIAAGLLATVYFASCNNSTPLPVHSKTSMHAHVQVNTPAEARAELKAGNGRYVGDSMINNTDYADQRQATANDQHPHSVILSCMDSRVPPEIVFDQPLGEIFVARVAGNIEDSNMLGSMEYATKVKGSKLIVVMAHQSCGAVKGAIDSVKLGNLTQLVDHIQPAIPADTTNRLEVTAKNNVKLTIAHILAKSPIIDSMVNTKNLAIVGAYYDLKTGVVTFLN